MNKKGHICILDSGIGGVTVLSELLKLMPNESYIYFGDIKNSPYGEKTTEEIQKITLENIELLLSRGAKAIVIACNTATGAAAKQAREQYPDLPIIGVEPAVKPAVTAFIGKKILVMATPLTLKQEKFDILYHSWNNMAELKLLPCPGLASLIENGHTDDHEIKRYLANLFEQSHIDTPAAIVLGCTHYPIIKDRIKEFFPSAEIFDGGEGTARQTKRVIEKLNLLSDSSHGKTEIITSSAGLKATAFKANALDILSKLKK